MMATWVVHRKRVVGCGWPSSAHFVALLLDACARGPHASACVQPIMGFQAGIGKNISHV